MGGFRDLVSGFWVSDLGFRVAGIGIKSMRFRVKCF